MYLAEVFKTLGDETRLRILNLLYHHELCVCQMMEALLLPQPNASKHLNKLRDCGIISCRKISQWCFYSVSKNFMSRNPLLFEYLEGKWEGGRQYFDDLQRLTFILKNDVYSQKLMKRYLEEYANQKQPI